MKYIIGIIIAVLLAVGVYYYMTQKIPEDMQEGMATSSENSAQDEATERAPTVAAPMSPVSDATVLTKVEQALKAEGSMRCTWIDRTSGAEGLALIKNGKVRVETKHRDGTENILLYTSAGTYIWEPDAEEGTVVTDLQADAQLQDYRTRSDLEQMIRSDERVDCTDGAFSDSHFTPPSSVTFSTL